MFPDSLSVHHSAPWARPEGYRVADAVIKANNATLFLVPSCRKESRSYLYINVPIVCIFLLVFYLYAAVGNYISVSHIERMGIKIRQ